MKMISQAIISLLKIKVVLYPIQRSAEQHIAIGRWAVIGFTFEVQQIAIKWCK